ncbi:UDP-glucosyltransferase 29-like [Ziziphus jujuba]|uniref:Glycosyltransferase n=1 Tax=Ziziphus jujuba TaxID=326968 RepID=A0A6P3ZRX4_ZIZJJ|nr:UDP-glucosyltransferase 29-like [Ziziphus jujuba]
MEDTKKSMRILMLPWLAQGHISPFLELAKKLTHRNFHIYLCSSPINLSSIKKKVEDDPKYSNSIQLVDFHVQSFPELPPQCHTTKGLTPHLLPNLIKALNMSRSNFSQIVQTLKPDLIINDFLPTWVPDVASSMNMNIPTVSFMTTGASSLTFFIHLVRNKGEKIFPFQEIYSDSLNQKFFQMIKRLESDNKGEALQFYERSCNIVLIRSFRELEGKYMDYLFATFGKKIVPVGPLVPDPDHDDNEGMDIIKWLDEKEKSSTVFVSFGSECYPSKEDMKEIAHGLELSKVNFIWVVRFPKGEKMKLEDALPSGFLERVREKGLVVQNWAPQVKILAHVNIGGFVSHCGWGSFMESIRFGVPIIAIPMQFEQPLNSKLAEVSRIGMEAKRDNDGKLQKETVAKVINEVVVEKIGEEIRRRTKEMKDKIETKVDEEMDEVVKELLLLL